AGPYAYKLKKAVRLPFLDATAPARRRSLCEDELRLNWRLAVPIYLGVLPITCEHDGKLALAGDGPGIERVAWMRRLPAQRTLDRLGAGGGGAGGGGGPAPRGLGPLSPPPPPRRDRPR